ncbi:uncharacterized protein KQ657_002153 [Scheffersomyces spartinae]|uniref:Major facilitator superfamily (MFS) profile domain-containing protein n=1 Tax=Scheffersomyces spartinae TaxID=45513 RepID=A0A9P8AKE8_9ASCO|nr:uncharacterized protein KQ657_002153 [Scheffersomyces spartinae]KAG7195768.1 hypothetical protein KQ657_002153 [Scheffersomyces spartinae]
MSVLPEGIPSGSRKPLSVMELLFPSSTPHRPHLNYGYSQEDIFSKTLSDGITHTRIITSENTSLKRQLPSTADVSESVIPHQVSEKLEMSLTNPPKNKWRVIAIMAFMFSLGMNDGAPGALIPSIEEQYHITYSVVSLIWMGGAAGYILVACLSHKIQNWIGTKQKTYIIGCTLFAIMHSIVAAAGGGKFPPLVLAFFLGGMGSALLASEVNIFLSRLAKQSKYLGLCHAMYGAGATVSPTIATVMIERGIKWSRFYLISVSLMVINCINLTCAFKGAEQDLSYWYGDHDEVVHRPPHSPTEESDVNIELGPIIEGQDAQVCKSKNPKEEMVQALLSRVTWFLAFFVFFYQGSEVALGGWIVTFLLKTRGANVSAGYVATGFWAGLTIGRLMITRPLHKYIGARRGVLLVSLASIIFITLCWAIPSVIATGVFVSLAGVTIGPNYPLMVTLSTQIIPKKIQVVSLTIITALGCSGGALIPFLVGLGAQSAGTFVVFPIFLALYVSMIVLWLLLPNIERTVAAQNTWQKFW